MHCYDTEKGRERETTAESHLGLSYDAITAALQQLAAHTETAAVEVTTGCLKYTAKLQTK